MDIYTADRQRTGKTRARGGQWLPGEYYLLVHLCVFNAAGELLIQQRAVDKTGWPDLWDLTLGGCAQAGEDSLTAILRESAEELGLHEKLTLADRSYTFHYDRGFDDYYVLRRELDPEALTLQAEEVQNVRWASRAEVHALLAAARFVPYFPALLDLLFAAQGTRWTLTEDGGSHVTGEGHT